MPVVTGVQRDCDAAGRDWEYPSVDDGGRSVIREEFSTQPNPFSRINDAVHFCHDILLNKLK